MSCLTRGAIALACFTLVGCDQLSALSPFNGPPRGLLTSCTVTPDGTQYAAPLSYLVDAMNERGWTLRWQSNGTGNTILRAEITDPLDNTHHKLALQINDIGPAPTLPDCGPRIAKIARMMVDGEEPNPIMAANQLGTFIEPKIAAAKAAKANTPAPAATTLAPSTPDWPSNASDATTNAAAAPPAPSIGSAPSGGLTSSEANDPNLRMPIRVDDGVNLYCCLTVAQVIQHFRKQGSEVAYHVADESGEVDVFVTDPGKSQQTEATTTLAFDAPTEFPGQLVLINVFRGSNSLSENSAKLAQFLRDEFSLHQRPR